MFKRLSDLGMLVRPHTADPATLAVSVRGLLRLGYTDQEIADELGVTKSRVYYIRHMNGWPGALKRGQQLKRINRDRAIERVKGV